jgi:hypothetical protein
MLKMVARFDHSYQKRTGFTLKETSEGQYHVETGSQYAQIGWNYLASLANGPYSTWRIGGEWSGGSSLTASIPMFDGTNYQNWSKMMQAYLKTQGLWFYLSRHISHPPTAKFPNPLVERASLSETAEYESAVATYRAARVLTDTWDIEDDKALGIMMLNISSTMQYLAKGTALLTWNNIKEHFDTTSVLKSS